MHDKGMMYAVAADIYRKAGFNDMWDILHARKTGWEPEDPEDAVVLASIHEQLGEDFLMPGGWSLSSCSHGGKREQ